MSSPAVSLDWLDPAGGGPNDDPLIMMKLMHELLKAREGEPAEAEEGLGGIVDQGYYYQR